LRQGRPEDIDGAILESIPVVKCSIKEGRPEFGVSAHSESATSRNARSRESEEAECPISNGRHSNCSVCMESFAEGQDVRVLPCDHIYHQGCIDPWLLNFDKSCPLW
jgi:hypothetical protein